jgi:hypothetical protein
MAKANNNITNFLAEVRNNGLAKINRFEVTVNNPPCVSNNSWGRKVSMFCDNAQLPVNQVITSRQQLFGPPSFHPVGINKGGENLGLQFLMDKDMQVKYYFDAWVNGIIDPVTFTTHYQADYLTSITINQLDEADNVTYSVTLVDAFPNTVMPMTLDHLLPNQVHKLNVGFSYRTWKVNNPSTIGSNSNIGSNNGLGSVLNIAQGVISYISPNLTNITQGVVGSAVNNTVNQSLPSRSQGSFLIR